jgi:Ferritin-like
MIRLQLKPINSLDHARDALQTAIGVEFGTLPPYLYALYSIKPGTNAESAARIKSVVLQEMIHMCLACNILNALGGDPRLTPQRYPGPLPGDIGPNGTPLTLHLYPFSSQAMEQAMAIEQPEKVPDFPVVEAAAAAAVARAVTIGEFYRALDAFLATLPDTAWQAGRRQIVDDQFFSGQLFAVNRYADAKQAIEDIVSEGEGAKDDPLDFQHDIAHFYRFGEIYHGKVLTKADNPLHYAWGPEKFPVDWSGAFPAISDPGLHDFANEPAAAQATQKACDDAYGALVTALQAAVTGQQGALGRAVRAMYDLRSAALHAFTVPLADPSRVAGPAFRFKQS